LTLSNPIEFLTAELAHAERHLARVRRIAAQMETELTAQGLSEIEVYEKLALSKAYRQLQRDEVFFQQMWLRIHRHLSRLPQPKAEPKPTLDETLAQLERDLAYRKLPTPDPNQPCACGSNIKYKKCCGNPLRQMPRAA
jgi:SEC-C motif